MIESGRDAAELAKTRRLRAQRRDPHRRHRGEPHPFAFAEHDRSAELDRRYRPVFAYPGLARLFAVPSVGRASRTRLQLESAFRVSNRADSLRHHPDDRSFPYRDLDLASPIPFSLINPQGPRARSPAIRLSSAGKTSRRSPTSPPRRTPAESLRATLHSHRSRSRPRQPTPRTRSPRIQACTSPPVA
jgi:hypothetical protein